MKSVESEQKTENENKPDKSVPACCVGCVRWQKFGRSCWYYWEGKKHCTMWISSWEEAS